MCFLARDNIRLLVLWLLLKKVMISLTCLNDKVFIRIDRIS